MLLDQFLLLVGSFSFRCFACSASFFTQLLGQLFYDPLLNDLVGSRIEFRCV